MARLNDSTMQIPVEGLMQKAWSDGVSEYVPRFRDVCMEPEICGDSKVSLRNLRLLLAAGLKVCNLIVGTDLNVLVVFATGESYLATGFRVGDTTDNTTDFAQFCYEAKLGGTRAQWVRYFTKFMPETFVGAVSIPPPSGSSGEVDPTGMPSPFNPPRVFRPLD